MVSEDRTSPRSGRGEDESNHPENASRNHADSRRSLEVLSPKPHFPAPVLSQVHPSWIHFFDQSYLLVPAPAFQLLLAANGGHHVLIALVIDEPVHFVLFGETFQWSLFCAA